jgi:ATP-binding protein involved in chromosome partitioning
MSAMSELPDRSTVLTVLNRIRDPRSGRGLDDAGLVQALVVRPDRAGFMLEVAAADVAVYAPVREAAEAALLTVPGVTRAQVVLTADGRGDATEPSREPPQAHNTVRVRRGARLSPEAAAQMAPPPRPAAAPATGPAPGNPAPVNPAHVRKVIAVSSAKGGVGKSTIAVSLACAFAQLGYATGILDADIYGPSIPRMLGSDAEPSTNADRKLVPIEAHGLKAMSIGFIVDEGAPMIWRGPMASSAVNQLLNDVAWGSAEQPLDLLVIDMPPGTGDIQLTIAQRLALSGAVIVSTPQEIALIDVRRGAAMFEKTATPILGVIENMAWFPHPVTGEAIEIFGRGGARATADAIGAPFLGEAPIDIALRQSCDDGAPLVAVQPEHPTSQRFMAMAAAIAAALDTDDSRPAPRLLVE